MSSYIPFRLRHPKDDDIKNWIAEELERAAAQEVEMDRSDIIRAALRFYFRHKNNPFSVANGGALSTSSITPEVNPNHSRETERPTDPQHSFQSLGKPYIASQKKNGKG